MLTTQNISQVEAAATIQAARDATLALLFTGLTIADRRAQIREQVSQMGTKTQLVQLLWTLKLNKEGFRLGGVEKTKRGIGYKRR